MNKEVKKRWLEALRSGKFKQAQGFLHLFDKSRHHTYCCLGVLCKTEGLQASKNTCSVGYSFEGEESCTGIPSKFLEKIGLQQYNESTLINMNDGDKLNFTEIANWIETNL